MPEEPKDSTQQKVTASTTQKRENIQTNSKQEDQVINTVDVAFLHSEAKAYKDSSGKRKGLRDLNVITAEEMF